MDFTVTQKGLEEQLLGRVIGKEQKALEEQLSDVLEEVNSNTKVLIIHADPPFFSPHTLLECKGFASSVCMRQSAVFTAAPVRCSVL